MEDKNIIRLTTTETTQYSVYWVNFPLPMGRHPAVVISHDDWADNSAIYTVAPICSSGPRGHRYEDLWVPIMLEPNRVSNIQMNSVTFVSKGLLATKMGYIPNEYRSLIQDRFMALITGAAVERLVDVGTDETGSEPEDNSPTEEINEVSETTTFIDQPMPENWFAVNETVDPISTVPNYKYSVPLLRHIINDPSFDVRDRRNIVTSPAKISTKRLGDGDLLGCLVALIREYGFVQIKKTGRHKNRFESIVDEMVDRKLLSYGHGQLLKQDVEFHKEFASPMATPATK